ncbi:transporter substrate-binding domain-containing protein, partial [Vibrio harveyi]
MSVKLIKRTMTAMAVGMTSLLSASVFAGDLQDIKDSGVLRHIGVPYANFVSYID